MGYSQGGWGGGIGWSGGGCTLPVTRSLPRLRGVALRDMPDGADERAGIIVHRCAMLGAVHGFTFCNSTWYPGTNSKSDRNKHIRAVASKNKTRLTHIVGASNLLAGHGCP
jgi:hypothetical protein